MTAFAAQHGLTPQPTVHRLWAPTRAHRSLARERVCFIPLPDGRVRCSTWHGQANCPIEGGLKFVGAQSARDYWKALRLVGYTTANPDL